MTSGQTEPKLRFGFVEMLFALTAAEIAVQAADVVKHLNSDLSALPAYGHLLLATALVTTSWVGWLKSKAPGNALDVERVFSTPFLVLLLDVFLVVCYFMIVRGVDVQRVNESTFRVVPAARNETFWTMVVFVGYFVWDVLTKAVIGYPDVVRKNFGRRVLDKRFWSRSVISFCCLLLAIVAWYVMNGFSKTWSVVAADISLICLILLFRALKESTWGWSALMTLLYLAAMLVGVRLNA